MISSTPLTVLNVDDNPTNRYVITKTLRAAGFEVQEASSGTQALELARNHPTVILLDVNLPDINGFEVCQRLKSDTELRTIPIVHLTASYASTASKVIGLEGGADGYLSRPVDSKELVATIHSVIRAREAERVAREMSEEWQATFDAIGDAACLVNPAGEVIRFNRSMAHLVGQPLESVRGRPLFPLLEAALGPSSLPGRSAVPLESRVECELASGAKWYRITADPVPPTSTSAAGAVYIVTDITERMQATRLIEASNQEIQALNQRLRQGMRETHHRVKNNLQIIAAMVDLQSMEEADTVPTSELSRLSSHIKTLAAVHDLLTEHAGEDARVDFVSAKAVLERLLPQLRELTGGHGLDYSLDDALLSVRQGTSLALLANEVVSNAVKHGGGDISISFAVYGSRATLVVSDNGAGFPEGFDPNRDSNTGLELVNNLSRWDLGGVVSYDNAPAGGARVTISMPVGQPPAG